MIIFRNFLYHSPTNSTTNLKWMFGDVPPFAMQRFEIIQLKQPFINGCLGFQGVLFLVGVFLNDHVPGRWCSTGLKSLVVKWDTVFHRSQPTLRSSHPVVSGGFFHQEFASSYVYNIGGALSVINGWLFHQTRATTHRGSLWSFPSKVIISRNERRRDAGNNCCHRNGLDVWGEKTGHDFAEKSMEIGSWERFRRFPCNLVKLWRPHTFFGPPQR